MTARSGVLRDVAAVLGVLVLSSGIAVLALLTARGVVHLGDDVYSTEFISDWWWSAFLLVPATAFLASRRRPAVTVTVTAALVGPHLVAAAICAARYRASGWSDGLEGLGFLHPVLLAAVTWVPAAALRRRA